MRAHQKTPSFTRKRIGLVIESIRPRLVQNQEAVDILGNPVQYDDPKAIGWDIAGAMAKVFGLEEIFCAAGRVYALMTNSVFIPPESHGFKTLVDWWDSMGSELYRTAIRRLEEYVRNERTRVDLEETAVAI